MKCKIAELIMDIDAKYDYTREICRPYSFDGVGDPAFSVSVSPQELKEERLSDPGYETWYYENLRIYRKICSLMLDYDGMLMHSAAVAVDGKAYLFTAVSGTGKTTHITLWKKLFGDRAVIVNGDKPLLRRLGDNGDFFVCGTPWAGKEGWHTPINVPIKAICVLTRAEENSIYRITPKEALPTVLNQTLRPREPEKMDKLLSLTDALLASVPIYRLGCNMDIDAARVAYEGISGEKAPVKG